MKTFCQIMLLLSSVIGLLINLYKDTQETDSDRAVGGAAASFIVFAIFIFLYWKAGAMSNLF